MQTEQIGAGLSARRKQLGLSQEELAKRIGVTRQAVSKWESGAALPSVDNIVELARVLEISVDELLQLEQTGREAGLSAQSVGLLLDEHSQRQERRMKRLTWALAAAAAVLGAGIVVSVLLGMQLAGSMEENLNLRITSTNSQLQSQISGIQADISTTVKQALDEGSSLLADFGFHDYEYVHESNTVEMKVFAYPKTLGEYSDAEFYALLGDGTRVSAPAEMTSGGFEAVLSLPAADGQEMYVDGYVCWNENGRTVTEKIFGWTIWLDELRMIIGSAGMHSLEWSKEDGKALVWPFVDVIASDLYPEIAPAKVLFEIYAGSELRESIGLPCEWEEGMVYERLSTEEAFVMEDISSPEALSMHVTVTDRKGNEFEADWRFGEE